MKALAIEGYRLSFQQRRLWLSQQDGSVYNSQIAIYVQGQVETRVLRESVRRLVMRHQTLRTTFQSLPGMKFPVQVIENEDGFEWEDHRLPDLPPNEREAAILNLLEDCCRRSFDLQRGPLLRVAHLDLSQDQHLLIITTPSLCADSKSLDHLATELGRFLMIESEESEEEPVQYLQFSEWQNDSFESGDLETEDAYRRGFDLTNARALKLPFEQHTSTTAAFVPRSITVGMEARQTDDIEALALSVGVSTEAVLLAALAAMVYRLTENPGIIISNGSDGRGFEELQDTVGPFAQYLPLRYEVKDELPFIELADRIHETQTEGYPHQDYFSYGGFDESTRSAGDGQWLPLAFDYRPQSSVSEQLHHSLSIYDSRSYIERFKLRLFCLRKKDGLSLTFDYDPNLFEPEDVCRLMSRLQALLAHVVRNPHTSIGEVNILGEVERRQVILDFNDTKAEYPSDSCIHELIEIAAKHNPEAKAVSYEGQSLTYGELDARSNQLANFLCRLGVGPEVPVAICMDRSLEMMVGILGILKAGGAYVPLNPELPPDRLEFIIKDVGASVLLTQKRLLNTSGEQRLKTILIDAEWEMIAQENSGPLPKLAESCHLAYVIYTSGSTGQPKGVMVTHRNLVHSTFARFLYYQDRVTNFMLVSPFSFDSSIAGIFWTLCQGGTLTLAANDFHQDLSLFISVIASNHVSHILCIPSLYEALLQHSDKKRLYCLKAAIVAGESCSAKLVTLHEDILPNTLLFNEYGPTECSVWSSVYRLASGDGKPLIGKPIANAQIYLLDQQKNPVPIEFPGEMYIGGVGVARGYVGLPALTAEKFVPDPFSAEMGSRMYRSGDLARYLPSGDIDFMGRIDNQVKIRGFRIELEEIEAVLKQHPGIRDAVVIVSNSTRSEKLSSGKEADSLAPDQARLIAYFVPQSIESGTSFLADEIRSFLADRLPAPMIPVSFIAMGEFPLTPNGKVDRKALSALDITVSSREKIHVAPQGELELLLADIWQELLRVEKIGRNDNFFEMGGDSIKGILLINKVQERLGRPVDIAALLQSHSLADLASHIVINAPTVVDLTAEAVLDENISPESPLPEVATEPRSILLTGATGFLGAFLLEEILRQTRADVFCLVRSTNAEEGAGKIKAALESFMVWDESFASRIIALPGNLSKPLLGLSSVEFQTMAGRIDLIYHNGAFVNFVYPYSALKPVNVLGTREVLRLACQTKVKPVHYISTISVFSSIGDTEVIREEDEPVVPDHSENVPLGYAQSKWVAEKLVLIARSRGVPVSIYRPGRITGDSRTGSSNKDDFSCRYIKGCVELGSIPDWDGEVNIAPVDYVSKAIVHLSLQRVSSGRVFHLMNPQSVPWTNLVEWFRSYGYPIRQVSYKEWREAIEHSPDNALYPLLPIFPSEGYDTDMAFPEISAQRKVVFDCQNTFAGLANSFIDCPPTDSVLVNAYLSYLVREGFMKPPSSDDLP